MKNKIKIFILLLAVLALAMTSVNICSREAAIAASGALTNERVIIIDAGHPE